MKKWRLSSSQTFPSKGMEKLGRLHIRNINDFVSAFGSDGADFPQDLEDEFQQEFGNYYKSQLSNKHDEEDNLEENEENEQDYTPNDNLSETDSDVEEVENIIKACKSPFLSTIEEFCLMEKENKIRKGESWNCKACNFSNFSSRLSCYKCKCWKWANSDLMKNFPAFVPKEQVIKLIKNVKKRYKKSNTDGLVFSKGPRFALNSTHIWNSVLVIEQPVELSFNAKRQVMRATQIYIRGGNESVSLASNLRAKSTGSGPHSFVYDSSNRMSASHNVLDDVKGLIKDRWWKSEENWLTNEDWTKLSIYERTMLRFKFSFSHLNVDAFTWNKFSYNEKTEFSRRKKRWIKEHMKSATDSQKKMMVFWKSRFRWKKMIWSIKDQNWKNYINDSFSD